MKCDVMYCKIPQPPWNIQAALDCVCCELFNNWEGRGYDDSVPGEVTKTPSSGDRTT